MPVPPKTVRNAAARGLKNRQERAKSTKRPGGTAVGVSRARDLKNGRNVSAKTLKRMKAFFDRHDTAAEKKARKSSMKTPAGVSWDLWGGNAGRRWANAELKKLSKKGKKS